MADINKTSAWVTARLTELGNATNDGLNTLITSDNIDEYAAGNVTEIVEVEHGGTGADNATQARENLGITAMNLGLNGTSPIVVSGANISHANSGAAAGSYGDSSAQTPAFGGTFKALRGTVDSKGHLTALSEHTVTIPSNTATEDSSGLMSAEDKENLDSAVSQVAQNTAAIAEINEYDDICKIISISDTTTTLGDVASILSSVNSDGDHVFFDMHALGVMMYLCTIFIDTSENVYKVFDLVSGRYAEGAYDASMLLTMATAQANGLAVQSQIDRLQTEIDELGGKSVIANWDVLMDMVQAGTSTDLISAGDTVPINWIKTVLGTTTSGLTVTCSDPDAFINGVGEAEAKDYLFVYDGTDWTYNGDAITLNDFGLSVSGTPTAGEVMNIKTTVDEKSYTFVDYDAPDVVDANVTHNWMLEQTYAPDTKAYCTYQALFAIYQGKRLPVGNYHLRNYSYRSGFYVDMYLSVTSEIGSDDYIVQASSTGYTSQTITNADNVTKTSVYGIKGLTPTIYGTRTAASGAVAIAYTPASGVTYTELTDLNIDPNDPVVFVSNGVFDKCALGSNTWEYSNMSEWLNDDTAAKASVEPIWMLYVPAAYNLGAGFLYGIDPRVKKYIQTRAVKWISGYGNDDFTRGTLYTTQQKVFLLSMKEMSFSLQTDEGVITDLYGSYTNNTLTNDPVAARAKYNKAGGTLNNYRWGRSALSGYAVSSRGVTSAGSGSSHGAYDAYYYAPAFIIGKSGTAV